MTKKPLNCPSHHHQHLTWSQSCWDWLQGSLFSTMSCWCHISLRGLEVNFFLLFVTHSARSSVLTRKENNKEKEQIKSWQPNHAYQLVGGLLTGSYTDSSPLKLQEYSQYLVFVACCFNTQRSTPLSRQLDQWWSCRAPSLSGPLHLAMMQLPLNQGAWFPSGPKVWSALIPQFGKKAVSARPWAVR